MFLGAPIERDAKKSGTIRTRAGKYIGAALSIALIESHAVSRPVAFLLVPWLISLCLFIANPPHFRTMWQRAILISAVASTFGYVLVRFVLS